MTLYELRTDTKSNIHKFLLEEFDFKWNWKSQIIDIPDGSFTYLGKIPTDIRYIKDTNNNVIGIEIEKFLSSYYFNIITDRYLILPDYIKDDEEEEVIQSSITSQIMN